MTNFKTLFKLNSFSEDPDARAVAAELLQERYNCEIHSVEMDPTVQFAHNGKGCTIASSKISSGVIIFQNVTIGANQTYNKGTSKWENLGGPVIGRNVIIADGAKVVGPVIVGDNSIIGTGAIITKDVPANSIAFGVNKIKKRDADYDPIFYTDMPDHDATIAACNAVIERYNSEV
ncbi:LbetaH domain-containing protein [Pediococcus argentinicus]|uniref:Galactoside O-acetyltransferase n=1 Tax=Pediococcus argentinicus TaxID=480391 RepID=A0A0R2NGJ0_9LACO|nr:serine acetyltransferase [Pediococcus argentinicus]KRO24904.1 galactoside O-acetyltransferase [Pediococcus argentinicus]NKZ22603.1 serine acetyltransferase [Pediococcus argentinicus]GEP19738.1 serine acetyltransferase [Pediococcus argentinicus]